MEDSVSTEPTEMTEAQKNLKQIASIWGAVKYWWCGICGIIDAVAPILVVGFGVGYAIAAYENTINDTKTIIPDSFSYILLCGAMWWMMRKALEGLWK